MPEGPRKSKYDTNPLPPIEEVLGVDTEAPTRPIDSASAPDPFGQPMPTDPSAGHTTGWRPNADTGPYATAHDSGPRAYTPPPPPVPYAPQHFAPPGRPSSILAQLGITPNFGAMACYAPYVGLVPSVIFAISEPHDHTFIRFHAKQAIFAHIAFWAVTFVLGMMRAALPWPVNMVLVIPQVLVTLSAIVGFVVLMIKSYHWKMVKLPIIGDQVE